MATCCWNSGRRRSYFDGIAVALPPHAFLQATKEGEAVLQARVLALTEGAKTVADLFAGLGTFSLPLARRAKVHAVEQDAQALAALAEAAREAPRASSPSPPKSAICSSCR